tara:strand:- start:1592 stop:2005 length:414 start_codon:yes stop_codon:yes gene_type:complete
MGLDCYLVHGNDRDKPFTHEDAEEIKDVQLCGGMLSGGGSDGSFRGKVYEPFVDKVMGTEGIWHPYDDEDAHITADELKEQAKQIEVGLSAFKPGETISIPHPWYDENAEYEYKELKDLATLLHVAGSRGAVMLCWY